MKKTVDRLAGHSGIDVLHIAFRKFSLASFARSHRNGVVENQGITGNDVPIKIRSYHENRCRHRCGVDFDAARRKLDASRLGVSEATAPLPAVRPPGDAPAGPPAARQGTLGGVGGRVLRPLEVAAGRSRDACASHAGEDRVRHRGPWSRCPVPGRLLRVGRLRRMAAAGPTASGSSPGTGTPR